MNIELEITAAVAAVSLKTKLEDELVLRVCKVTFKREFDSIIAAALGADAIKARESLVNLSLKKVVIPLDAICAKGILRFRKAALKKGEPDEVDRITIKGMRGLDAVATAGKDGDPPQVTLSFEFTFAETAMLFLCRHHTAWVDIALKDEQMALPFHEPRLVGAEPYVPKEGEAF